jgi:hypothetical protein
VETHNEIEKERDDQIEDVGVDMGSEKRRKLLILKTETQCRQKGRKPIDPWGRGAQIG